MTIRLEVQRITADNFAPYGWLACAEGRTGRPINEGSSLRVDDVGALDLIAAGGAPCLAVFRAQARDPRGPWQVLEPEAVTLALTPASQDERASRV